MGRSEESDEDAFNAFQILRPAEVNNMSGTQNDNDETITKRRGS